MNKLVAIVGMSGTGKSVVTDYLEEQNWKKLYFGGITYKLMKEAGIERTEDGKSEKEFREKLRKDYGPECYAKFLEPEIKEALKEAILSGVSNIRYIDKILFEWNKKGYKKREDIVKKSFKENDEIEELYDYDWLNE